MSTKPIFFVPILLLLASCTRADPDPIDSTGGGKPGRVDSESHFLSFCAEGCAEGLRCVCGVCTRVCDGTEQCDDLGQSVECVPPTPAEPESCVYARVRTVCDLACSQDADCAELGGQYVCDVGVCRQAPQPTQQCGSIMTPACDSGEELVTEFDENGCATLSCEVRARCAASYFTEGAPGCEAPAQEAYWFNAATGRCEVHDHGNCPTTDNSFETLEQCWSGCAPDYEGSCITGWDANFETADVQLVAQNNLMLGPASISKTRALEVFAEPRQATLTYPDKTQTQLILEAENVEAYHMTSIENPTGSFVGIGPYCWDTVVVEADVHFYTEDGRFDEHWQRVRFTVNEWNTFANVSLQVEGDWWPARQNDEPVAGTYRPDLASDACSLGSHLSMDLVAGAFSGSIYHTVVDLPCDEVTETTGISNSTPTEPVPPQEPPPPSGPVWSTSVRSPIGQFCTAASPNVRGPGEPADSVAAANLYEEPQPDDRLAGDAASECEALGGVNCDPGALITLWAAECIARADGLEAGITSWSTSLNTLEDEGRLSWSVSNTLTDNGTGQRSGESVSIDAISGEVTGRFGWMATP